MSASGVPLRPSSRADSGPLGGGVGSCCDGCGGGTGSCCEGGAGRRRTGGTALVSSAAGGVGSCWDGCGGGTGSCCDGCGGGGWRRGARGGTGSCADSCGRENCPDSCGGRVNWVGSCC